MKEVNESLCYSLWGNLACNWSDSPVVDAMGRLLSIWCNKKGKMVFSFAGLRYLGVCLEWGVNFLPYFMVNVYAMCSLVDKRVFRDLSGMF